MLTNFIKKITIYKQIIKLKSYWISHIAVLGFYMVEFLNLILYIYDRTSEDRWIFIFSMFVTIFVSGFAYIALAVMNLIYSFVFKKELKVKNLFLINNKMYHILWIIGMYIVVIGIISITMSILKGFTDEIIYYTLFELKLFPL